MHVVIFEVEPEAGREQDYLDIAARLRPELEKIDGFVSIERFRSLSQEGKIMSLSFWRDEDAIARWRQQEQHRVAQRAGRERIFRDYRIRVAAVMRDYGMDEREQAPQRMPPKSRRHKCRYSQAMRGALPSFAGPRNISPFWIVNAVLISGLPSGPALANTANASRARPAASGRIRPLCTNPIRILS